MGIGEIEAVGRYAVRPTFTDGHDSGIYSWDCLFMLGERKDELWRQYPRKHGKGRREPE